MCYGAQVWGWVNYEQVEKLQYFFLKRVFQLPSYTPNYFSLLQLGLNSMLLYTYQVHVNYISKVLSMDSERWRLKIAKVVVKMKVGWYEERLNLLTKHGIINKMSSFSFKGGFQRLFEVSELYLCSKWPKYTCVFIIED